jgi:hypothetical protein
MLDMFICKKNAPFESVLSLNNLYFIRLLIDSVSSIFEFTF